MRISNPARHVLLTGVADAIAIARYQPMYRLRRVGDPVRGWPERLQAYFWPAPWVGYGATEAGLHKIRLSARSLACAVEGQRPWTAMEARAAVELANEVFQWGKVRQSDVTEASVRKVFENALANETLHPHAPMNSGWTKLAAFATEHLEVRADGRPQVIWDSRVACALIWRLDSLMVDAGIKTPTDLFQGIGKVPGRGGTRTERYRALKLSWPNGYQRWDTQFAASALVRELRDILNADPTRYGSMPLPIGGTGAWTVRGVEMVLFGDGY